MLFGILTLQISVKSEEAYGSEHQENIEHGILHQHSCKLFIEECLFLDAELVVAATMSASYDFIV